MKFVITLALFPTLSAGARVNPAPVLGNVVLWTWWRVIGQSEADHWLPPSPLFRALNVRQHLLLKNLKRQRAVPEHDIMEFALVELRP